MNGRGLHACSLAMAVALAAIVGAVPPTSADDISVGKPAVELGAAEPAYVSVGDIQTAAIDNKGAVRNGATKPVTIKLTEPIFVRSIQTYHWNNGRGQRPGTIAIRSVDGTTYGPWQATGKPGQGGVRNAYWYVEPGVILLAGTYVLNDSNPGTWATNDAAGNKGFVVIQFQKAEAVTAPPALAAPADTGDGSVPSTSVGKPIPQSPAAVAYAGGSDAPPVADTPPTETVLFDGTLDEGWREMGLAGGNFAEFASIESGVLVVDVPEGHSWGKTGIASLEPVVKVPEPGAGTATKLTFAIDPQRTSAFVFSLLPPKSGDEEWSYHHVRIGLTTDDDGKSVLILWIRQVEAMRVAADAEAVAQIGIVLRPDGTVVVVDRNDDILLQGILPDAVPREGYLIHALAHAPRENLPAKLALRRISLEEVPDAPASDPGAMLDGEQQVVLFDGRTLGRRWTRYNAHGGDFAKHARLQDGALLVDVPEGAEWGKAGLYSPDPLIWLDRFGAGAEERVTFTFDPERTTGFVLAVTPIHGLNGNEPSKPFALLHWRQNKDGTGAKASFHLESPLEPLWEVALPARAPDTVSFVFTPLGLRIVADGMPDDTVTWAPIAPSQSFRIYAYSQPDEANAAVRMALRQIVLDRRAGAAIAPPKPAAGVADLPVTTVFAGEPGDGWEPAGGAYHPDYAKYVSFADGSMIAEVPGDLPWGKAGLLSTRPILDFDERIERTSYKLAVTVDPKQTTGFQIMFAGQPVPAMWEHRTIALGLIRYTEGPNAGKYVLGLGSGYRAWYRAVDAGWMDDNWDGTLEIETGDGWMVVGIPGGPVVRGIDINIHNYSRLYMTVYAHPEKETGASSRLVLRRITGAWLPGDGMTAVQRWIYLDKQAFDPAAFLKDLAAGLPGPIEAQEEEPDK